MRILPILSAAASAAFFLLAAPASAADWTGFYVGGQLGYRFGQTHERGLRVLFTGFPGGFERARTDRYRPDGVVGGGRIGYDFRLGERFVVGALGDFSWGSQTGSWASRLGAPPDTFNAFGFRPGVIGIRARHLWDASIRARGGVLVTDDTLLYATAGVAFMREKLRTDTDFGVFAWSRTRVGWTLGAGVEHALTEHWRVHVEYRRTDFGTKRYSSPNPLIDLGARVKTRSDVLLTGVSYRF